MTEDSKTGDMEKIKAELESLEAEYNQLERNLPPHSIRPHHLQRIEELEDLIEEKKKELAALGQA